MSDDARTRAAKVLAMHRRIDLGDDERFHDDGTRDGYWNAITSQERELMLLRADSVLAAASSDDASRTETKDG